MLLKEDVEKLKNALNTDFIMEYGIKREEEGNFKKEALHIANYGKRILELCDATSYMAVKGENSPQIIEYILKNLVGKNLINEDQKEQIKERLLKRESLGKIVLPNKGFVIYHCTILNIDIPIVVVGN